MRLLRQIVHELLQRKSPDGNLNLGVYLVADAEMTRLNETFLHHKGSTDVITFDYAEEARPPSPVPNSLRLVHGEVFVCVDEALSQASRFHVSWQNELVRYIVHGVLHLLGYDDRHHRARRTMKLAENAMVRQLAREFDFRRIGFRPANPLKL
ncbi:MAG TPA: rRNA maturation RNase YbeY [Candidatus Paceibacterota bacterium]|nr:rRNA maturation RNase YbeY [Verrucomicrobiota bacterium]HSA12711.1 rRNA maturation RNase YbeY [Candidatus Paceibacterota bacterium]